MFLKNFQRINTAGLLSYFNCKKFSDISRKQLPASLLTATIEATNLSSVQDWKNVRKAILTHETNRGMYTEQNIDALLLNYCIKKKKIEEAVLYFNFIDQEGIQKNLAVLGKHFELLYIKNEEDCFKKGKKCPHKDEELIIKNYLDLRKEYPIMDSLTLERIIPALSMTKRWTISLELLSEIKRTTVPNSFVYSTVASAAFLNGEEDLAWNLLLEMISNDKVPNGIEYLSYLASLRKTKNKEFVNEKLEKLFNFFRLHDIKCDQEFILYLSKLIGNCPSSNFTKVTRKGICHNCQKQLEKFDITNEEFEELKKKIFENVIIGKDVFIKTTPNEVDRFKNFIKEMDRYDVVLDGLNIAYTVGTKHSPQVYSALVAAVVFHFSNQNKNILLLGRVHMNRWPKQNWKYIVENSKVFLTQDLSQDDPYLLYCALNSGKDTIIVTRDLMRGHKFLLKLPRLKMLFHRWLTLRQYQMIHVNNEGRPFFKQPPAFSTVVQKNGDNWHIPYIVDSSNNENETHHKTWFCLKC